MPPLLRVSVLVLAAGLALAPPARGDEGPTDGPGGAGPAPSTAPAVEVGVVTGDRVNLRVGPRIDNQPVTQLEEGQVVLIVGRFGDWLAVHVPAGFPAAISLAYAAREDADHVRVNGTDVNLRVAPPQPGMPAPSAFLDHPARGALLTLIDMAEPPKEGKLPAGFSAAPWAWVVAPEEIRAFVHERYVRRLGPLAEHVKEVDAARARRATQQKDLSAARAAARSQASAARLMDEVAKVQEDLVALRRAGGTDKMPVVALANRLDVALRKETESTASVLALARALREDLEREITLRVARYDAEVAKMQGLNPPTVPPLEETKEKVVLEGEVRFEPTPGWSQPGVYFLWVEGHPRYALRLTTGGPLPHPDFAKFAGAGKRVLEGRLAGDRRFGLPVFEVRSIRLPDAPSKEGSSSPRPPAPSH